MLRDLIYSGWRNLSKSAYFSSINLSLLAIGITAMLPIANYIFDQNTKNNSLLLPGNIIPIESVYTSINRFDAHRASEHHQEIFSNKNLNKSVCTHVQKKNREIRKIQILNYLTKAGFGYSYIHLNSINAYCSNESVNYSTTFRTGYFFYERSKQGKKNYNLIKREL
ncbi:MAG: hypothetical protein C5B52_12190 [Bacteroidetes bacterium]|nr:MAG: hypothetical protein C5B52_12190 [Bacteroidota bacterium]